LASFPIYHPISLMNSNRAVFGINLGHLWDHADLLSESMAALMALWSDGTIAPVIDSTFPFDEAGAAHDQLQLSRNIGKVLLIP